MKAVVMAGGRGTRLRPLTDQHPKPMLPFIDKPVLAHTLNLLKHFGFTEVIITVHYLAEQIQDYFGDGHDRGMSIRFAVETTPLGTAGSVKNAEPHLGPEPFLVISGDIITDIDLGQVLKFHQTRGALITLILKSMPDVRGYGMVTTDHQGKVTQYTEKPACMQAVPATINTGIYMVDPTLLGLMKRGQAYDFSLDIFPKLLARKMPIFGFITQGYWSDIGTIESFLKTGADALAGRIKYVQVKRPIDYALTMHHVPAIDVDSLTGDISRSLRS
jgi:mannose-1-phosphate guanylyltransferase/phosphomannomutase